ncbi:MAG: hypothetical protein RLZZ33_766 [Pseudomonadota bacterium]|jgi:tRNA-specific 2-thiouridylase
MKIVVGLSGGVDSAVAALRLRRQGHELQGLFMANWAEDDSYCTIADDYQDARAVCRELDIPLHRVDFAEQYRQRVFDYFLTEYRAGRTPNPDVLCNREIKFGVCLEHVRRLGGERFATGHYARRVEGAHGVELHKALDHDKDQSYFLHALELPQLHAALFPIGESRKAEIRAEARAAGLPVYDKPDSTGICFIGERPFREFLAQYVSENPGPIETAEGEQIGTHRGLAFYTLGQRGGLEIGGRRGHDEAPWYVARKDLARNTLVAVQGHDHPLMQTQWVKTGPMHWLIDPPRAPFEATVKLRYRQPDQTCRVELQTDGGMEMHFESQQRAVTPGQFAVLYQGTRCLGGAVIESL